MGCGVLKDGCVVQVRAAQKGSIGNRTRVADTQSPQHTTGASANNAIAHAAVE
jgi:hypothetical protein